MHIQCPKCTTRFSISDEAIANIVDPQFHCSRCSHYFTLAENGNNTPIPKADDESNFKIVSPHSFDFSSDKVEDEDDDFSSEYQRVERFTIGDESEEEIFSEDSRQLDLLDDQSSEFELGFNSTLSEEPFENSIIDEEEEDEPNAFAAKWPEEESEKSEFITKPATESGQWSRSNAKQEEIVDSFLEDDLDNAPKVIGSLYSSNKTSSLEENYFTEDPLPTISEEKLQEELDRFFPVSLANQDTTDSLLDFKEEVEEEIDFESNIPEIGQKAATILEFPEIYQDDLDLPLRSEATANKSHLTSNPLFAVATLCSIPLLFLAVLGYLSTQNSSNNGLLTSLVESYDAILPTTPPTGVELLDLTSKIETLSSGLKIVEITGAVYNATLETFREIVIRAQLFSHDNRFIEEVLAPADNSLQQASLNSLDLASLNELQQLSGTKHGLIRPNEKLPFRIVLAVKEGEEAWFSARVHSVIKATSERLLKD